MSSGSASVSGRSNASVRKAPAPPPSGDPEKLRFNPEHLTPKMQELIAEFDVDGDGEIDIYELLRAMQILQHTRASNKQLLRMIGGLIVLVAIALTAIFAVCVAAAVVIKDTRVKSNSDAAVMRSKAAGDKDDVQAVVRTGSVNPVTPVVAESATPAGEVVQDSTPIDGPANANAIPAAFLKHAVASSVCESTPLASSTGLSFLVSFQFAATKGVLMTIEDSQLPLSLEVNQPDGTIAIVHTRVVGKRSVDLSTQNAATSGALAVLDLESVSDDGRRARVCCVDGQCVYAPGTAASPAATEVCTTALGPDLVCQQPADLTSTRNHPDPKSVALKQKTTIRHYFLGPTPWTSFVSQPSPLFTESSLIEAYEIPRVTTMATGTKWVCRNGVQPVFVAKSAGTDIFGRPTFQWVNLQLPGQSPNAHLSLTGPTANLATMGNAATFLDYMSQSNPVCPTNTAAVLVGYVSNARVFLRTAAGATITYDFAELSYQWSLDNAAAHSSSSSSVRAYDLPVAVCSCLTAPVAGTIATLLRGDAAAASGAGAFRV